MKIFLLLLFLLSSSFALDLTNDSGKSREMSKGNTKSNSKDVAIDDSESKSDSKTTSEEKSKSVSKSLSQDLKVELIVDLAALERANIEPFSTCSLLIKPKNTKNFDLTCDTQYGFNTNRCSYLDNAAKNFSSFLETASLKAEWELKIYALCGAYYGAIIAQTLKTGIKDFDIKDKEIKEVFESIKYDLKESECNFVGSLTSAICGSVQIEYSSIPVLKTSSIEIFGGNKYYGFDLNIVKDKRMQQSLSKAFVSSNAKSKSLKKAQSVKQDEAITHKSSQSANANLSLGKFVSE